MANSENETSQANAAPDVILAAEAARAEDPAANTRAWLLETHAATLCTVAAKAGLEGYPFGSVVPFALDAQGRPLIFVADIAAHTANLKRDPRATLFVSDPAAAGDPQQTWRIGVMGTLQRLCTAARTDGTPHEVVSPDVLDDVHARYVERVPAANDYAQTHGFAYWRMNHIERVRYIAGFGKICWIDGADVLRPTRTDFAAAATAAADHMNEDHGENMCEMVDGHYGHRPSSAKMFALDAAGFSIRADDVDHPFHFSFGREISAADIRPAIIDVLKKARTAIAQRA